MMKKLIAIFVVVVTAFCAIVILTKQEPKKTVAETETVDVTIPNLTPEELETTIAGEENVFIYMYSPTCVYCQQATPIIMPIVYEHEVPLQQFNVQSYGKEALNTYDVDSTPTLLHFQDGKEVARLVGLHDENEYLEFLTNN